MRSILATKLSDFRDWRSLLQPNPAAAAVVAIGSVVVALIALLASGSSVPGTGGRWHLPGQEQTQVHTTVERPAHDRSAPATTTTTGSTASRSRWSGHGDGASTADPEASSTTNDAIAGDSRPSKTGPAAEPPTDRSLDALTAPETRTGEEPRAGSPGAVTDPPGTTEPPPTTPVTTQPPPATVPTTNPPPPPEPPTTVPTPEPTIPEPTDPVPEPTIPIISPIIDVLIDLLD